MFLKNNILRTNVNQFIFTASFLFNLILQMLLNTTKMQTTGELTSFFTPENASLCNSPQGTKSLFLTGSEPEGKFMLLSQLSLLPSFQAVAQQGVKSRTLQCYFTHQNSLNLIPLTITRISSHWLKEISPEL